MIRAALAALIGSASLAAAEPFQLAFPVDCTLGETCYIQQYVDHDPGPGARDFTCGGLSYDGHKGTDFGLPTQAEMARGVPVLAAAPGVVRGMRDGMADRVYGGEDLAGRDCGNGIVLRHGDGWETQYCHMRQGSVRVTSGQEVAAGAVLGLIGLSGRTEFPHLHVTLRQNGEVVDPFAPEAGETCGSARSLWAEPLAYVPGGLLDIGFASRLPGFDEVQAGTADLARPGPDTALVGYGYAFGVRSGDVMEIGIDGPSGEVITQRVTMDRTQATAFRAAGRKRQPRGWPVGDYLLTVRLLRAGEVLSERTRSLSLE
ncbi:MAG: M23 family metallopeptidase [Rhodobacteraceae bacterium]|nr:MAG: M23 family metallopeptidase [Paracoccaceae bacterium]